MGRHCATVPRPPITTKVDRLERSPATAPGYSDNTLVAEGLANEIAGASANGPYLSERLKGRDDMAMQRPRFLTNLRNDPPRDLQQGAARPDPVCPWEIPLDHDLAIHLDPWGDDGEAYVPSRWGLIPEAATQALSELISVRKPHDLLVVPSRVRRVRGADVYCPAQVLGAGEHGVALWVDDLPYDRVAAILAYRDIRMLEHTCDTESAHLTVIGATRRFTVHYRRRWRPSSHHRLTDLLVRIRLGATGVSEDFGRDSSDRCPSEAAWLPVGHHTSRAMVSLSARGRSTRSGWQHAGHRVWRTVAVNDRELLVLREPAVPRVAEVGNDVLAVPCRHLRALSATGPRLCIDAGATHTFTVGAAFAKRVVNEFSPFISQPSTLAPSATSEGAGCGCH